MDSLTADPVISKHLLIVQESCAASKQSESKHRLWKKMADALAAIRMATESNVSLVAPTNIVRLKTLSLLGGGSRPELERSFAYPLVVADESSVRTSARLGQTIPSAKKNIAVAVRRFNLSFGRRDFEDRLIDLVVGLEALYLPDGDAELKYRLQIRAAYHLGDSPAGRSQVFEEIGALYKMRSKIVHGSAADIARSAKKTVFEGRAQEAMGQAVKMLARGCARALQAAPSAGGLGAYFDSLVLGTTAS